MTFRDLVAEDEYMSRMFSDCFEYWVSINPEVKEKSITEQRWYFLVNMMLVFVSIDTDHGAHF